MADASDILIIGGGVIGSACAYYLAKDGVRVTLIDKGSVGHGCSYGNAGLIVPSHAFPLPMPGAVGQGLKWMCRRDSPLYIKPRLSIDLWRWLWRFARCSNQRHMHRASEALAGLAQYSARLFDQFVDAHGRDIIRYEKRGAMFACQSAACLEHMREELRIMNALGWSGRAMDAEQTRDMNPALGGPLAGSVYYEHDAHVEPLKVVQTFSRLAEEAGAAIWPGTEVFDFDTRDDRITAAHTTRGTLAADRFILATGSWTPAIARRLRLRVPIQAGKGYAIIVDPFDPMPSMPTLLVDSKVAVTPRDGSVRLAGTMELAGMDESISAHRVDAILRAGRRCMTMPDDVNIIEVWRGLRPCTPDGLPIIGRAAPWQNLAIAAGHAMLGLTLSTGTGRALADIMRHDKPDIDMTPFDPTRRF